MTVVLLLVMVTRKVKLHEATVIVRVIETDFTSNTPIMGKGDLQNHFFAVILSKKLLIALMEKHDTFSPLGNLEIVTS